MRRSITKTKKRKQHPSLSSGSCGLLNKLKVCIVLDALHQSHDSKRGQFSITATHLKNESVSKIH